MPAMLARLMRLLPLVTLAAASLQAGCGDSKAPLSGSDCFSGGVGYATGSINPTNDCQSCAVVGDAGIWTNLSELTSCDGGICLAGRCGPPPDGTPCDGGVFVSQQCTPGCWLFDAGYLDFGRNVTVGPGFVPPTTLIGSTCTGCIPEVSTIGLSPFPVGTRCYQDGGDLQECIYLLSPDVYLFCGCDGPMAHDVPDSGAPCCDANTHHDNYGFCVGNDGGA
jgi:hypothetical protein